VYRTQLASQTAPTPQGRGSKQHEKLQNGIYPSPGGSDEFIPLMLARKTMPRTQIDQLKGKLTGLRDHGEKITLNVVKLDEVWKTAWRDGKTLAALALYNGLKTEGML
jgi:ADP-sugar diphosphatase